MSMHRVLLLDSEHPLQLTEAIERTANTEVFVVADEEELVSKVQFGAYAAVFADEELLPNGASRLVAAIRSAIQRPMLIIASNRTAEDLDPDLVTLVVRKPYDVPTVTGILLAAVGPIGTEMDRPYESPQVC